MKPGRSSVPARRRPRRLAASLCAATGSGPTDRSETILLDRFASTPKASKTLLQDYTYTAELRARGMDAKQVHFEVTKRFDTKDYPNPARTGVAYMIAPVMRGWTARTEPVTMNMPHYMFYAPGVMDADIGGKPFSLYPFMLRNGSGAR